MLLSCSGGIAQGVELHGVALGLGQQAHTVVIGEAHPADIGTVAGLLGLDIVHEEVIHVLLVDTNPIAGLTVDVVLLRTLAIPGHIVELLGDGEHVAHLGDHGQVLAGGQGRGHADIAGAEDGVDLLIIGSIRGGQRGGDGEGDGVVIHLVHSHIEQAALGAGIAPGAQLQGRIVAHQAKETAHQASTSLSTGSLT